MRTFPGVSQPSNNDRRAANLRLVLSTGKVNGEAPAVVEARRPAGAMGEVVTSMIVKGLVVRDDPQGRLSLTASGRAVLKAMLPEL